MTNRWAMGEAMLAAILFGMSAPLAKLLLGGIEPIILAGLLYVGCGLGLLAFKGFQKAQGGQSEAGLGREDVPWLVGAIFAGGVAAPIVLLFSLQSTPGATASLLLNFEGVATTLIAALVFREAVGRRTAVAVAAVTAGSIFLSWDGSGSWGLSLGALGVMAACVLWGIDNNLTRQISAKDGATIVLVKGLGAGTFSLLLGSLLGNAWPTWGSVVGALLLGCLSYGLSLLLFVRALRGLGAARTSVLFGTAPLAGVLMSFVLLHERPSALFLFGFVWMLAGMALLLIESHGHIHRHDAAEHDHSHDHDEHHDHSHDEPVSGPHSHHHRHDPTEHEHAHAPDIHHRHDHDTP